MAVQILSQSYGPRKPLIECTADSLDDLVGLVCAEGSTATVGGTEYVLDRVNGWVEPGSGGGGGGGSGALVVNLVEDSKGEIYVCDKTAGEMFEAMEQSGVVIKRNDLSGTICTPIVYAHLFHKVGNYIFMDYNQAEYQASSADDYPEAAGK